MNELQLTKQIEQGNSKAWNIFVNDYSDYVLGYILRWCNSTCSIISESPKECEVKQLYKNKFSQSGDTCDEGLDLYEYIFRSLRKKVGKFQGKSSLKTFVTSCFKNIRNDFFIEKYGKITIPDCLKDLNEFDTKIYKILCKSSNPENVIDKLDLPKEEFYISYNRIVEILKAEGKEWHYLLSKFAKNTPNMRMQSVNQDGEEEDIDIASDKVHEPVHIEFREIFIKALNNIDPKQKRIMELKFSKNLDAKTIFDKFGTFFNWKRDAEFYPFLDKSVKALLNEILKFYSEKELNPDLKAFKDNLEDFFKQIS